MLPGIPRLKEMLSTARGASTPLATLMLISALIPDRFEYRQGATYVDSTIGDLFEVGAGRLPGPSSTSGSTCCATTGIAARYVSGYLFRGRVGECAGVGRGRYACVAGGAPCPSRAAWSPWGSGPIHETAAWSARTTSRSATAATTPTSRRSRASSRHRQRAARRAGHDDPPGACRPALDRRAPRLRPGRARRDPPAPGRRPRRACSRCAARGPGSSGTPSTSTVPTRSRPPMAPSLSSASGPTPPPTIPIGRGSPPSSSGCATPTGPERPSSGCAFGGQRWLWPSGAASPALASRSAGGSASRPASRRSYRRGRGWPGTTT